MKPRHLIWGAGILLILIIIVVIILPWSWWCRKLCPSAVTPTTPPFHVFLYHGCVGAWTPINNSFATANQQNQVQGVLVQLGTYKGLPEGFKVVNFYKDGATLKSLSKGSFAWLNIRPSTGAAPMNFTQVKFLMPPVGQTCKDVETCAAANCFSDPNQEKCFRQNKLHPDLDVDAILTIWPKTTAHYEIEAKAWKNTPALPMGNMSYDFKLDDTMQIEAYDSNGAMLSGFPIAAGEVDEVEVAPTGGPGHGGMDSPPWPKP